MSAFVVKDKTINRVITHIAKLDTHSMPYRIISEEQNLQMNLREDRKKLGQAMLDLNCNAVQQRYSDSADMMPDAPYRHRPENVSMIQAYKSLRCWLYQCAEGDLPETSLLYATMVKIAGFIAEEIVQGMPEYDAAEWA